jgi:hypothetical protein
MFFCPHAGGARADGGSDPPLALLLAAALASVGSSGQRAARPTGNAPHREMIELIGSLRWRPVHLEGPPALRLTTEERQHPKNRTPDSSLDASRPHPRPHEGRRDPEGSQLKLHNQLPRRGPRPAQAGVTEPRACRARGWRTANTQRQRTFNCAKSPSRLRLIRRPSIPHLCMSGASSSQCSEARSFSSVSLFPFASSHGMRCLNFDLNA